MREKEMRKERYRRSPQRHSPDSRRKNFVKLRKRSRSNGTKSISRSKSRSRSPRYMMMMHLQRNIFYHPHLFIDIEEKRDVTTVVNVVTIEEIIEVQIGEKFH